MWLAPPVRGRGTTRAQFGPSRSTADSISASVGTGVVRARFSLFLIIRLPILDCALRDPSLGRSLSRSKVRLSVLFVFWPHLSHGGPGWPGFRADSPPRGQCDRAAHAALITPTKVGCSSIVLFVGFSDDRRLEFLGVVIVIGVSWRHRVAHDGGDAPVDQPAGNVLGDARGYVGLLLNVATFTVGC